MWNLNLYGIPLKIMRLGSTLGTTESRTGYEKPCTNKVPTIADCKNSHLIECCDT